MSLKHWEDNGWLTPHRTSREEISNLFSIVERDLADAQRDISTCLSCCLLLAWDAYDGSVGM